jgi:hypothetical protein
MRNVNFFYEDIFPFLWFFVSQNKNYEVSEEGGRGGEEYDHQ